MDFKSKLFTLLTLSVSLLTIETNAMEDKFRQQIGQEYMQNEYKSLTNDFINNIRLQNVKNTDINKCIETLNSQVIVKINQIQENIKLNIDIQSDIEKSDFYSQEFQQINQIDCTSPLTEQNIEDIRQDFINAKNIFNFDNTLKMASVFIKESDKQAGALLKIADLRKVIKLNLDEITKTYTDFEKKYKRKKDRLLFTVTKSDQTKKTYATFVKNVESILGIESNSIESLKEDDRKKNIHDNILSFEKHRINGFGKQRIIQKIDAHLAIQMLEQTAKTQSTTILIEMTIFFLSNHISQAKNQIKIYDKKITKNADELAKLNKQTEFIYSTLTQIDIDIKDIIEDKR